LRALLSTDSLRLQWSVRSGFAWLGIEKEPTRREWRDTRWRCLVFRIPTRRRSRLMYESTQSVQRQVRPRKASSQCWRTSA